MVEMKIIICRISVGGKERKSTNEKCDLFSSGKGIIGLIWCLRVNKLLENIIFGWGDIF